LQAKAYTSLLRQPNVGLALDPEWALGPGQRPLQEIGSLPASKINEVFAWLSNLTAQAKLPQMNLIHDLTERGIGLRTLADPIRVDTTNLTAAMSPRTVVMLALFAEVERTYSRERAAHARSVDPAWAVDLRDIEGATIADIVAKTGIAAPICTGTCRRGRWSWGPGLARGVRGTRQCRCAGYLTTLGR